jgi:predicted PurR-regulated permease PerM
MSKQNKMLLGLALALITLSATVVWYSSAVFLQLLIAFILAYMLNPAILMLEKRGLDRTPSILIVFSSAAVLCAGFTLFLAVSISSELSAMQINLPGYAQHLYQITPPALKSYLGIETPDRLSQQLNELLQRLRSMSPDQFRPLLEFVRQAFSSTIGLILTILGYLIIPVYLFYLLADLPRLKAFLESFIPERHRAIFNEKLSEVDRVLAGFIRGQLLVCAILAVLYSVGLYLIGIDLAIAIGTLAGAAFIIPYVGTLIGIVLSVFMALLKFHDFLHPLLCLGWFGLVQALEGMLITPRVVGNTVGLHPLVTLVVLLIGGQLFGLMGMLLAVPVCAVARVFLISLAGWFRNSEFYRGA